MGLRISKVVADRLSGAADAFDAARPLEIRDPRAARGLAAELSPDGTAGAVTAGRLKAAIELALVLRRRLEEYFSAQPELLDRLLERLIERSSATEVQAGLAAFEREFMPAAEEDAETVRAAAGEAELGPLLVEAILAWALDSNPAAAPVSRELQGPAIWSRREWRRLIGELSNVLEEAPPLDARSRSLGDSLRAPVEAAPDSLSDQLRYLLDEWNDLGAGERQSLVGSIDLISEEEAPRFAPGPGPVELPDYDDFDDESPNYSADLHWMEPLVLIAKNSYVWLDQLSRRHGREIERLDQIPDPELDRLAEWGVSGLWLIGVWERSSASARIKRRLGNADALASAYSLRDYTIADDLGGAEAVASLAERAAERGIRLAADMVPNHMGIDSSWLLEQPELFLSVAECPFPAYRFDGPDLSPDPRVGIYLEDHYWDRTDAAVVFKRVDRDTGEVRYVYHGNDGTSTPWNDTAQLDYLNPRTREAVLETILRVAGWFPIIRFDAAMTLAHRHVQRLWYPEPGGGGAIPSRSEHALSRSDFKRAMPSEFWREVVDRVGEERQDTLLLAEAFWLMEGYFVRSLGMHRVYNSAFMNLLRDGETAKLRRMIRETLGFDPQILKRYVNFLSNPDEASAVEQFGSGDRYFGACVALATLPGLPMLAHGQFEGYREKYGMEFRRARLDEEPDTVVLGRHRREIVPLLRRRDRFAGVDDFRLLDLQDVRGEVNGNVLAYANGREVDRSIVLFNNSPERVRGTLGGAGAVPHPEPGAVYRFRDRTSGLHFLAGAEALGTELSVELEPFESRVLVDFRPVLRTVQEPYAALAKRLAGRGVRNVELELELLDWLPLVESLRRLLHEPAAPPARLLRKVEKGARRLRPDADAVVLASGLAKLSATDGLWGEIEKLPWPASERMQDARRRAVARVARGGGDLAAVRALVAVTAVKKALGGELGPELGARILEGLLRRPEEPRPVPDPIQVLGVALEEGWLEPGEPPGRADLVGLLSGWMRRSDAVRLLGLNRYAGEDWFRKEELELVLEWRGLTALCAHLLDGSAGDDGGVAALGWLDGLDLVRKLFEAEGYAFGPVRNRLTRTRSASGGAGAAERGAAGRKRGNRRSKLRRPNRSS